MKTLTTLLLGGAILGLTACTAVPTTQNVFSKMQIQQTQTVQDQQLQLNALHQLLALDSRFAVSRVNVHSFHGYVLLTGQVLDPNLKEIAFKTLKNTTGVRVVHNFITIEPQISYEQMQIDRALLDRANQLIRANETLKNSTLFAHAEDNVLYLMGRVNVAENIALTDVLSQVKASKVVLLVDNVEQASSTVQNSTTNTASTTTQITSTLTPAK